MPKPEHRWGDPDNWPTDVDGIVVQGNTPPADAGNMRQRSDGLWEPAMPIPGPPLHLRVLAVIVLVAAALVPLLLIYAVWRLVT